MKIRSSLGVGFLGGLVSIFVFLLGLTNLFGQLFIDWFNLSTQTVGAWALLVLLSMLLGSMTVRQEEPASWGNMLLYCAIAGAIHAGIIAAVIGFVGSLIAGGMDIRGWLIQLSPDAVGAFTLEWSPWVAAAVLFGALTVSTLVGGVLQYVSLRQKWGEKLGGKSGDLRTRVSNLPVVQRIKRYKYAQQIGYVLLAVLILSAPLFLGQYWNYTMGTVGIYVILGLGLNIVVGMAGLLDLGYVAFFAIGAYTVALLTAPHPHDIGWNFWVTIPIGVALAACVGVLLGIPVLRMRGDYLAIVTLGFGEIIRILSKSDLLTDFTGGPRGVRSVGGPSLFGINLNTEFYFMYLIILGIILAIYVTHRLQHSRVGRAWMAMREDEDVAEGMGVFTLKYKLLAFAIGAAFAGLSGVIFASRNKFTGPGDFTLLVSINVLSLVIIGGMGSIPGVIMGALVLKGLPEILRQLDDYRMLAFGALLIVMMILRPEGLWPSQRRKMEFEDAMERP